MLIGVSTAIHKFDISSPTKTVYRGSGSVSGYLLSQWSLSEFGGVLRVVSTETPAWWGEGRESESYLTTLREQDGALSQVGRIGGLGKGERVYAVRFVGNTGYVVTFRQVDPLFVVDLAAPTAPKLLAALKIPGFSEYMHPLDDTHLLTIGRDASATGRTQALQLQIFDVTDGVGEGTGVETKLAGGVLLGVATGGGRRRSGLGRYFLEARGGFGDTPDFRLTVGIGF